jgi:hypothetical protein
MKKFGGKYPLVVENHPEDYDGYEFMTLIRYNDEDLLNIVDNVCNKQIVTYVLDYCKPAGVNEEVIVDITLDWYVNFRDKYPISIAFSKMELSEQTTKILRCFPIDYVSRVIGPLPEYNMAGPAKVKKRKRRPIPKNIEFINKSRLKFDK